jgi:Domain of unknown function (DUF5658)
MCATPLKDGGDEDRRERAVGDRRRRPTGPWDFLRYRRRKGPRREDERREPYFVDRLPAGTMMTAIALIALSGTDAIATLVLLRDQNIEEVNPFMRALLGQGVGPFLVGKLTLTVLGVLAILIAQYHYLFVRPLRVHHLLTGITLIYAGVNLYEVYLLVTG